MQANTIITQPPANGQETLQARQFRVAFLPPAQPAASHLADWSTQASQAITTLIDFRSALHRWQAARDIPSDEYTAALERLDAAGLADWLDNLLAVSLEGVR